VLIFVFAFFISFVLVNTFSQDAFRVAAPVRFLGYYSHALPLYYFVACAFLLGLCCGLLVFLYSFFIQTAEGMRKSKKIKLLELEVETLSKQPLISQKEDALFTQTPEKKLKDVSVIE
jgi:uncharacterized membrane protein YciS (DUF1049 family)